MGLTDREELYAVLVSSDSEIALLLSAKTASTFFFFFVLYLFFSEGSFPGDTEVLKLYVCTEMSLHCKSAIILPQ